MTKKKVFEFVTQPIVWLFQRANKCNTSILERAIPIYKQKIPNGYLKFYCPNFTTLWRAKTLLTKEPDTIAWINSFEAEDVFYDVGANVGMYSLYAASRGIKVYAFEPEAQNYQLLNTNIYLNKMDHGVSAFNIALNNQTKMDYLYLRDFSAGSALHTFGSNLNYENKTFKPVFKQRSVAFELDSLIETFNMPLPNHLKIDVDGLEKPIIDGADHLLSHSSLKSVLIELNVELAEDLKIKDKLKEKGFKLLGQYHTPSVDKTEFKSIYNFVFVRDIFLFQKLSDFYQKNESK